MLEKVGLKRLLLSASVTAVDLLSSRLLLKIKLYGVESVNTEPMIFIYLSILASKLFKLIFSDGVLF